jgi:putative membrane protein
MNRLRNQPEADVRLTGLPENDVAKVVGSRHVPLAILRIVTARLTTARDRGLIDGFQLRSLDHNVELLVDYCGACERIKSTPLPFAYAMQLRRLLIIYCITLPLALIRDYGWATVPTTLILSYSLFGVEEIGTEIENPFGITPNDLPLETICESIESVLSEIRDEHPRIQ